MEGSGLRWRGAVAGGEERSQVGSDRRWRGAIPGGVERSLVVGSGLRWRGAEERSLVEASDRWWRGAVSGGGERSLVEGSGCRLRGAVSGLSLRWGAVSGGDRSSCWSGCNIIKKKFTL